MTKTLKFGRKVKFLRFFPPPNFFEFSIFFQNIFLKNHIKRNNVCSFKKVVMKLYDSLKKLYTKFQGSVLNSFSKKGTFWYCSIYSNIAH